MATVRAVAAAPRPTVETCHAGPLLEPPSTASPLPFPTAALPMDPAATSPALSVAITVLVVLLALTGFGIYTAFGPPSKGLTDPFDDHED
jgi:PsbN protein